MTLDISRDARPAYVAATGYAAQLIDGINPAAWTAPTPCPGWDVRTLVAHLVATVDRLRAIGEGKPPFSLPSILDPVPGDAWSERLALAVTGWHSVWDDDAILDRPVTMPWGTATGRQAVVGYTNELLVHCWDLATALDAAGAAGSDATSQAQPVPADIDAIAAALLPVVERILPASRGDGRPFAEPVGPRPDAGPLERLANWAGHVASR